MKDSNSYKLDYDEAFNRALDTARKCYTVEDSDRTTGKINCKTQSSIWSWGESVIIEIRRIGSGVTEITVTSSPSAQLFDWGKSKSNIEIFFNKFKS